MAPRIAVCVTDTLPLRAKEILTGYEILESQADDRALARCQVLICWPSRVKGDLLGKMKSLRMVQTMSAGVDNLEFASLPPDVQVFSNAGAFTESVAEHAWGLLLGAAKGVHLRNHKASSRRLRGKTLVVLGAGSIGSEVARLAKTIGMKTVGVSRSFKSPEFFDERYPASALAERIPEADAVVMALPLTKGTAGLMSYEILSRSKEDVVVVNVGRGESVPEEGLIRWLRERPESRFATDVFWTKGGRESFDTQAWDFPNFAGTLHVSGVPSGDDLSGPKVAAAWNVKRYFESGSALNHVDIGEYV